MVLRRTGAWARSELGRLEKRVLIGGFVVAACAWAFLAVAGLVATGGMGLDERVAARVRTAAAPRPGEPAWMLSVARDVTSLGSGPIVVALVGVVALGFALAGMRRRAVLAPVACIGGLLLGAALKEAFPRERPDAGYRVTETFTSSFPSGHALNAAVVYVTLGALVATAGRTRRMAAFALGTGVGVALLVGASRVVLGVHHATDVLAGWAAGFGWAALCWLVDDRMLARSRGRREIEAGAAP